MTFDTDFFTKRFGIYIQNTSMFHSSYTYCSRSLFSLENLYTSVCTMVAQYVY